jgi:UDP-N-acetylglucosamine 2-epimerase (non-hydrolysing)
MRDNTEHSITCTVGTNILAGTAPEAVRAAALSILDGSPRQTSIPEKWDEKAGQRIVETLMALHHSHRIRAASLVA